MNEDDTTAAADTSVNNDNINSEEGSVTPDEVASVLNLPKAEATEDESEQETEEGKTEDTEEDTDGGDTSDGDDTESDKTAESQNKDSAEDKQEETAEAPTFTIEIEDANGKKFTVSPDDNLEDVLAEFEPKNNGQVLQLMRDLDRLSGEKSTYESQQAEAASEAERQELVTSIQKGWDDEITRLQGEKRLPLDAKIDDRKQEVFKFMAEENEKREAENRPLLQSFEDALDKLELREEKEAKAQAAKDEKELNKRRGSLVGGSSAPATSGGKAYQPGSARNADEALRAAGLL